MNKLKVGIIFGGKSGEHEVSLVSAKSVINIMSKDKYEIVQIGITKNGEWITGDNVMDRLKKGESRKEKVDLLEIFSKIDVVFPVLHGPFGEDGTIQGLLEMLDVPYVGCGVMASSIAMDKLMTKAIWEHAGLPVGPYIGILRMHFEKNREEYITKIFEKIGLPCFVKPANMGSSVGITKVKDIVDLEKACELAFKFDRKIIVEKAIDNREIECSILGNDEPRASLPAEIILGGEFYDFNDKYINGKSYAEIPANIGTHETDEIRRLAIEAYRAIDADGMARVDFFLEKGTNKIYLNEINTIPGFTSISQYPKMWEATGISYSDLIDHLIELAIERHKDKSKNQTDFTSGSDWYDRG